MNPAAAPPTLLVVALATGGAVLSLAGTAAYLLGIRRGRTVPHRGSWLVWSVIAVLAAGAHGADGGRWSLLVLVVQAGSTLAVFCCAVRGGVGALTRGNLAMLTVAAAGVVGWLVLDDPLAATVCAAVADGSGLLAIVPKIWRHPHSETATTYALAGLTGLTATIAVPGPEPSLLLFPVYFCLANTATAQLITWRRRALVSPRDRDGSAMQDTRESTTRSLRV